MTPMRSRIGQPGTTKKYRAFQRSQRPDRGHRQAQVDAAWQASLDTPDRVAYAGYRELVVRYGRQATHRPAIQIHKPSDVTAMFAFLRNRPHEECWALYLNGGNAAIARHLLAKGGLSAAGVVSADIFRPMLLCNGAALILVHNHPSGSVQPSAGDIAFTRDALRAANVLGVNLLDHVIIGTGGAYSFADQGRIDECRKDLGTPEQSQTPAPSPPLNKISGCSPRTPGTRSNSMWGS